MVRLLCGGISRGPFGCTGIVGSCLLEGASTTVSEVLGLLFSCSDGGTGGSSLLRFGLPDFGNLASAGSAGGIENLSSDDVDSVLSIGVNAVGFAGD